MANKQLTAKVRLNTTQAEKAIDQLSKKINALNNALKKGTSTSSKVDTGLKKAKKTADKLTKAVQKTNQATQSVNRSTGILNTLYNKSRSLGERIASNTRRWYSAQGKVANSIRGSNQLLSSVWGKLKGIAATYLGIMGMKAAINTTDIITSAENKLNYVNGQQSGGTNADGSYTARTFQATQEAMDKMYTSAQRVRMGYTDMMANVSKSMALAGDSFKGNIDNAIRFQEVMAEAYAIGGASAEEMSSSMYQLIQALGAGTLAGDELRSVREGAPLAYKAIEQFAQGVYNTEESLKELASQGKVTSDMVVAAIMDASDKMDSAFKQTNQTFAQTWAQIKNAAVRAFSPIGKMLQESLQKALENGLIQKVENFFNIVSKAVQIVFKVITNAFNWIVENWVYIEGVVVSGLTTLLILLAAVGVAAFFNFLIAHWQLILVAIGIFTIIWALYAWQQGLIDTAQMMTIVAAVIAVAFIIIGIAMGSTTMLVIGLILAILAVAFYFLEYVAGGAMWLGALIANIVLVIWNVVAFAINLILTTVVTLGVIIINAVISVYKVIMSVVMFVATLVEWVIAFIVNLVMGCSNAIDAVCQNIGIAFQNAWNGALSAFWTFIAGVLDGLKGLEPAINAIAELFGFGGFSISGLADGARSKAASYQQKSYVSVGDAWSKGWNTAHFADMGEMVGGAWNSVDYLNLESATSATSNALPYADLFSLSGAYDTGKNWGSGVKNSVNNWGADKATGIHNALTGFTDGLTSGSLLDDVGKKLGLDFSNMGNNGGNLNPNSPNDFLNNDVGKNIGKTADNTGKMADSMELTQEDLDYLRRIADMEWKKEYTTASITVDMSNYNTINGESDLDGIVTKLSDKLYEELNSLADGVYA